MKKATVTLKKSKNFSGDCMERKQNKQNVPVARMLRKNMTKEERHLWYDFLRNYPVRFSRQKILGKYIADFYCAQAKLVIELDGSQHFEEKGQESDGERTEYLKQFSVTVIRIPNNEVNQNFRGVCQFIDLKVKQSLSHFPHEKLQLPLHKGAKALSKFLQT